MKKLLIYFSIGLLSVLQYSCDWFSKHDPIDPDFEDAISESIYDYIIEQDSVNNEYGDFLKILEVAKIDKTISAYNPEGQGYTLFLPTNEAVAEFVAESNEYSSLEDILQDIDYASSLGRYHVVQIAIEANDFPFGAMPKKTLSEDYLTVAFVIGEDSTTYLINNQAPVIQEDIEQSNGYIHILGSMLKPITNTSYEWLKKDGGFTIFTSALEEAGYVDILSRDIKDEELLESPVTLLVEPDSVYQKRGINSFDDLATFLEAENENYTDPNNIVNVFVGYHILDTYSFLLDFEDNATNFSTYTELPVNINGNDLDIKINKAKQIFDTLIVDLDTTFIDYVGLLYDESNVLTKSGTIHMIDQVMEPQIPRPATVTYEFREEPMFIEWREEGGEYIIDDSTALQVLSYTGTDMVYVKTTDEEHQAWSRDYLLLDGDFSVKYKTPKVVQGVYTLSIHANAYGSNNAVVQVFVDGTKIGGVIDLSNVGSSSSPYREIEVGSIDFTNYEHHIVELRALIPGRLEWDFVRFDPNN